MATSGSFMGSRTVTNGPQLYMSWDRTDVDIAGNRSKVKLTMRVYSQYSVSFSASKSGYIEGSSFTYSGGMSGSGYQTVATKEFWVSHNSDGTKSFTADGYLNINVSWSTGYVSKISVSGTVSLDTIPRASNLNSFSIGSYLRPSTANTVSLSLSRYSSGFTHSIYLKHGSTTIASWGGQGLPTSLSITATEVNTLLNRLSSSTSATMTLVVQTYSGSTKIGSSVSRTATTTVSSTVTPNISSFSTSIYGGGRDNVLNKYIQNISRVAISLSRTAGYGASIVSTSTVVRRVSGSADSQTIDGTSGQTSRAITLNGTYEARATVRDSRGATTTSVNTFTVHAYNVPRILSFGTSRNVTTDTTVNITRNITYSPLATGDNTLIIQVFRKPSNGIETNIQNTSTTSATYTTGLTSTGNDATLSYEFRLYITDSFGKTAESTQTISTSRVVLDIHQDLGIGMGKMHEQGALDVKGDSYFDGAIRSPDDTLEILGNENADLKIRIGDRPQDGGYGFQWVYRGTDGGNYNTLELWGDNTTGPLKEAMKVYQDGNINLAQGLSIDGSSVVERGSNSNGDWIKFYDGTMICQYHEQSDVSLTSTSGGNYFSTRYMTFPMTFTRIVSCAPYTIRGTSASGLIWAGVRSLNGSQAEIYLISSSTGCTGRAGYVAVGRWK